MKLRSVVIKTKGLPPFYLVLAAITLIHYPIWLGLDILKWDAIDITLPYRYFAVNCLQNFTLPMWNPYQLLGFPVIHIPDTYYFPSLLLGYVFGYSPTVLGFEYLLHILLASYGMYRLSIKIGLSQLSGLFISFLFPLSGFFIGNAHHIGWVISGAWIPVVIYLWLSLMSSRSFFHASTFCISLFFCLTGGYFGLNIVLIYILLIIGLIHFIGIRKTSSRKHLYLTLAWLLPIFLIANTYVIHCVLSLSENIPWGTGLSEEEITFGSFRFVHLLSMILPWSSAFGEVEFWKGDQSIINTYIGFFPIVLLVTGLIRFRSRQSWTYFILALLFLSLSFAKELPFRDWANHLPFFEYFRFSSLFRYFFIFAILISIGFIFDQWKRSVLSRKQIFSTLTVLSILFGVIFLGSLFYRPIEFPKLQAWISIQGISFSIVFVFSKILLRRWPIYYWLAAMIFVDMAAHTIINGNQSVYNRNADLAKINHYWKQLPKMYYPLYDITDPIGSNTDQSLQCNSIYRNTNSLWKRPGNDGYTPYQFTKGDSLEKTGIYRQIIAQPILFTALKEKEDFTKGYFDINPVQDPKDRIRIIKNSPNRIELSTETTAGKMLIYNQNFSPQWTCKINGNQVEIFPVAFNLMGINLPKGNHDIQFTYLPARYLHGLLISFGVLVLLGTYLVVFHTTYWMRMLLVIPLLAVIGSSLKYHLLQKKCSTLSTVVSVFDESDQNRILNSDFPPDSLVVQATDCNTQVNKHQKIPIHILSNSSTEGATLTFNHSLAEWDKFEHIVYVPESDFGRAQLLNSDFAFSSTFQREMEFIQEGSIQFEADVFSEVSADFYLVVSIESGSEKIFYQQIPKTTVINEWSHYEITVQIPAGKNGALKCYVWNESKYDIFIDNLEVIFD